MDSRAYASLTPGMETADELDACTLLVNSQVRLHCSSSVPAMPLRCTESVHNQTDDCCWAVLHSSSHVARFWRQSIHLRVIDCICRSYCLW